MNTLLERFQAGDSVYIAGSSAEPRAFVEAISQHAQDLPSLELVHSFIPGVNTLPLAAADNALTEIAVFPRATTERVKVIPGSYYGYQQYLEQREFGWAVVQLSPPDEHGRYCLGPSVEFMPTVLRHSHRVIGLINPKQTVVPGSYFLTRNDIDIVCEIESSLACYDAGTVDAVSEKISAHVATLIEDGSTLQLGLGKVPTKLLEKLTGRQNLRFHSGLLTAGFLSLLRAGALDESFKHATCASLGDTEFYHQLAEASPLTVAGVEYTHAPATLSGLSKLVAINSALQVDLSGQANLEYVGERKVSSVGGAADFAPAACRASDGKSIVALPATAAKGAVSRIQKVLTPASAVSLQAQQIDYVVTEYGVASLAGKTAAQRAAELVNIAAPEFRESLLRSAEQ